MVLKKGSRGAQVVQLQELLNKALPPGQRIKVDGDFGSGTESAVRQYQSMRGLSIDGVVGDATWNALKGVAGGDQPKGKTGSNSYRVGPQAPLAEIAANYVGATESNGNRAGDDKRMQEIFAADSLGNKTSTDGYAWCCSFVSLCVQKLLQRSVHHSGVVPPRVASVYHFRTKWAPGQECLIFPPNDKTYSPATGDIVVFTFSHIGIVTSYQAGSNTIATIEGNTNEAGSREGTTCRRKERPLSSVRCFIRLPVRGDLDALGKQNLKPDRAIFKG